MNIIFEIKKFISKFVDTSIYIGMFPTTIETELKDKFRYSKKEQDLLRRKCLLKDKRLDMRYRLYQLIGIVKREGTGAIIYQLSQVYGDCDMEINKVDFDDIFEFILH